MKLRHSGATFDGVVKDPMPRHELDGYRKAEDWLEAQSGQTLFFPAHLASHSPEGLAVYRLDSGSLTVYPIFALAVAAGWYKPQQDENSFPDFIRGVGVAGNRVWMGSAGAGIVTRDLASGRWSRYDGKSTPLPGIHSEVFHADAEYVFAYSVDPSSGWKERLPDAREGDLGPALEVYSLRRDRWIRVRGIPRANVLQFGWTESWPVAIGCDTRQYARTAVMPIEMCTRPERVEPAPEHRGYLLTREFADPGAPLRYIVRTSQLDRAFESFYGVRAKDKG